MQIKNTILRKILLSQNDISAGYSFRSKIEDDPQGDLKVIQLKDFNDDYTAIGQECFKVSSEGIKHKYILNTGDILFISKGQNNNAVTFSKANLKGPYIASSNLYVISVDPQKANPEYIAWYINQPPVQNYIKQNLTGTYTPTVNRKVVENIPLQLPSIEEQSKIAALGALAITEKTLRAQILGLRELLINNQLLNHINKK